MLTDFVEITFQDVSSKQIIARKGARFLSVPINTSTKSVHWVAEYSNCNLLVIIIIRVILSGGLLPRLLCSFLLLSSFLALQFIFLAHSSHLTAAPAEPQRDAPYNHCSVYVTGGGVTSFIQGTFTPAVCNLIVWVPSRMRCTSAVLLTPLWEDQVSRHYIRCFVSWHVWCYSIRCIIFGNNPNEILFIKKLRADWNQGMLAVIRCRIFCLPVYYTKM